MSSDQVLPDGRYLNNIEPIFSWLALQNGRALTWTVLQSG